MSIKVITAPEPLVFYDAVTIFLGGGITGCPDWQATAVAELTAKFDPDRHHHVALYNPRRPSWDMTDKNAGLKQIEWEFEALERADLIMMWFCEETVQPIAMYELGRHLAKDPSKVLIGAHPGYPRRYDVEVQSRLAGATRPPLRDMHDLIDSVAVQAAIKSGLRARIR